MLVRFVDQDNQVVRKVSQHYEVTGAIGEIDRARQGDIIFYRESELPPGIYSMETIVHDAPSGEVERALLHCGDPEIRRRPAADEQSDPGQARRDGPDKERRADNPLLVKDVILHPNLGDPISRATRSSASTTRSIRRRTDPPRTR